MGAGACVCMLRAMMIITPDEMLHTQVGLGKVIASRILDGLIVMMDMREMRIVIAILSLCVFLIEFI